MSQLGVWWRGLAVDLISVWEHQTILLGFVSGLEDLTTFEIPLLLWSGPMAGGLTHLFLSLSLLSPTHIHVYSRTNLCSFHGLAKPNRRYRLGVDRYPKNPCFAGPSSPIDTSISWQRIAANYRKWTSHPRRFRTLKKSSSNPCVRIESWTGSLERTG